MKQKEPVSVLVAPLDWGLGHATRCIPIINELLRQEARVLIAASGDSKALLIREFPNLQFLEIPGYRISYKPGILLKWALFLKVPYILRKIQSEHLWLDKILQHHSIDAVVSDNRYGLFNKSLFSIFITHQLYIQSGKGALSGDGSFRSAIHRRVENLLLKWNYKFIEKFSWCWVPDFEIPVSVAGMLSHPPRLPNIPVSYMGTLSRFEYRELKPQKNHLLILLSGPEPQRTRLENILLKQLETTDLHVLVVRGLPGTLGTIAPLAEGITVVNHLTSDVLNEKILEAEYIVARSGYSTIMDLVQLRKNAILIPTPGQTEQEYLGAYLTEKKWMYSVPQKKFNLNETLAEFRKLKLTIPDFQDTSLKRCVGELLKSLTGKRKDPGPMS